MSKENKNTIIVNSPDIFALGEEGKKFFQEYVPQETKKLALKFFKLEYYNCKQFNDKEFALIVWYAISRDRKIINDTENQKGVVAWRQPPYDYAPQIIDLQEDEKNYIFTCKFITKIEPLQSINKEIKLSKKEYQAFKEEYKDVINELETKESEKYNA